MIPEISPAFAAGAPAAKAAANTAGARSFFKDEAAVATVRTLSLDDRSHPIESRIGGRRVFELEQMLDDANDLAAHGIALALAQILDLLGDAFAVEPIISPAHRPQHLSLVLRPGVVIVIVARAVGHRRHNLEDRGDKYTPDCRRSGTFT